MKIYRIYKIEQCVEWDTYTDEGIMTNKAFTIKYVDSINKVNAFYQEIKDKNKPAEKCYHCPLLNLTKRQYNNGHHASVINSHQCENKDIYFEGNKIKCKNMLNMDFTDYYYEEIEVE